MIDPLPPDYAPHAASAADVLDRLQADAARGLPESEAAARRERYGFNRLPEGEKRSRWQRFLDQFRQFVVVILLVAAVIAGYLGDVADTLAILAIVLLNAGLGFFQEDRAERALESMKSLSAPTARVRRNGALQVVAAESLVPGDVVDLEAGDLVPADLRLLEAYALTAQEAALTGESVPVEKDADAVAEAASVPGDRINMLFAGTTIAAGKGIAVVAATGAATELGRIAGFLAEERRDLTPLQRRLESLGRALAAACLGIVAVIAALQLLRGLPLSEVLLPAVGLAVAAVPESLPTVVTVTLALGLQRLVRRQALVRKLPSVETLGSVTIICSDKTGTLTVKQPQVVRVEMLPGAATRLNEDHVLMMAGAVESYSVHILSKGIAKAGAEALARLRQRFEDGQRLCPEPEASWPGHGREYPVVKSINEDAGKGVSGEVNGHAVRVGRLSFAAAGEDGFLAVGEAAPLSPRSGQLPLRGGAQQKDDLRTRFGLLQPDEMASYVSVDGRLIARIVLRDVPRANAKAVLAKLHELGVTELAMLTGDKRASANIIASEVGIDEVHAELFPVADIGVAMTDGTSTAASESAQVVIMNDNIAAVPRAIAIARRTKRVMLQAVIAGLVLATIGMIAAAFNLIPVVVGAFLQEAIDVVSILWALTALIDRD